MKTIHEDAQRPAHDAAKSVLTKALDSLTKEQTALAQARADLDAFNQKLDDAKAMPKNAAHDGAELEGAISFYGRRVKAATVAVAEARDVLGRADYQLTEAKVLDRAEALASFDYGEWAAEFAAEAQEIADKYLDRVYALNQLEAEAVSLGRSIDLDSRVLNPENRARIQKDTGRNTVVLDGEKLGFIYPSMGLDRLRDSIRDTRHETQMAEAQREEREQRAQERAERKAADEQLEAFRRFEAGRTSTFEYTGGSGARPMVTRDQYGNVLNPMVNTPDGHTAQAARS